MSNDRDDIGRPILPPGWGHGIKRIRPAAEMPAKPGVTPELLARAADRLRANGVPPGPTGKYVVVVDQTGDAYEVEPSSFTS